MKDGNSREGAAYRAGKRTDECGERSKVYNAEEGLRGLSNTHSRPRVVDKPQLSAYFGRSPT